MIARWRAALCVAMSLLLVGTHRASRAEPIESPAELPLTVRTAPAEALRANPELRAAYHAIEGARGRLVQAGLWPNPEVGILGSSDVVFAGEGERTVGVGFAQRFPIAGRLARARDVARIDVELASTEARDFERTLIADVQKSVTALLSLDRAIATRDRVIEAARDLARASARRFEAAEVSEADLNLLEIELARLEQERRLLELERWTETVRFNRLLNRSPEVPVAVGGDLETTIFVAPPADELAAEATRRRPDLQGLRLEADRARADARLARAEAWEDWAVEASYDRDRGVIGDGAARILDRDQLAGLALRVPIPLWNRNQGRVAEALAAERRASARLEALERSVEAEIATARQRVAELDRVAREYRGMLVPRSERNVALLSQAYRQGLTPVSALVQAQQQLADASQRYVQTLGQLRQAEIELESAAAANPLLTLDAPSKEHP